ncbi:hypothetical protein ACNKHX_21685 [Shigella flexneri]
MPIPRYSLHRFATGLPCRGIGFALFWHDTWYVARKA